MFYYYIHYAFLLFRLYVHGLLCIIDQSVFICLEFFLNYWQGKSTCRKNYVVLQATRSSSQSSYNAEHQHSLRSDLTKNGSSNAKNEHFPSTNSENIFLERRVNSPAVSAKSCTGSKTRGLAGVSVVTGGCSGIGLETVKQLMQYDMTVVVGARDADLPKLKGLESQIGCGKVIGLPLDLSSLSAVREFARLFSNLNLPLHLLINNGGVMFSPAGSATDGYEIHFVVNYLSHVLLSHLLMKHMLQISDSDKWLWRAEAAHIVNLSSSVHVLASPTQTIGHHSAYSHVSSNYYPEEAYFNSKLAVLYGSLILRHRLQERGDNIVVSCLHPGVVNTNLFQHVAWDVYFTTLKRCFLMSPSRAAENVLNVALNIATGDCNNQQRPLYYNTDRKGSLPAHAMQHSKQLWQRTSSLLHGYTTLL